MSRHSLNIMYYSYNNSYTKPQGSYQTVCIPLPFSVLLINTIIPRLETMLTTFVILPGEKPYNFESFLDWLDNLKKEMRL